MTSDSERSEGNFSRRDFLRTSAVAGAGLFIQGAPSVIAAPKGDALNVAIIGTGAQGRVLLEAAVNIPNINFVAVCDMWEYARRYGQGLLRKQGFTTNGYEDYREMLDKEKDLDAVIVATPDFWHAPHSIDCMKAGLHVYCEKMMSNSHEAAREMVMTSRQTGKLLQIGHQRRSNPRYLQAKEQIISNPDIMGRITNVNGQWNRAVAEPIGWPRKYELTTDELAKYGYENMHEFRNWRWFKRYGGGPISDLGAHQIDIYNWFLGADPHSVLASGGADFYDDLEWYDNVMAIYEFNTPQGTVRAFYQVLTTTSAGGGYYEYFMGTNGALKMSENPKYTRLYQEANAPAWDDYVNSGLLKPADSDTADKVAKPWEKPKRRRAASDDTVDVRETAALSAFEPTMVLNKAIHQPHLENFFNSIRGEDTLNCPGEEAYKTEMTVLKVNEAIEAERKLQLNPAEFTI